MFYNQKPKNVLTNNTMSQQPYKIESEGRLCLLSDEIEYQRRKDLISKFVKNKSFCITHPWYNNPTKYDNEMYKLIYDWSIEKILFFGEQVDVRDFDSNPPISVCDKEESYKRFPYLIPNMLVNQVKKQFFWQ